MAIIGGLLIFNAIVGFSQDHHANSVVDALRRTLKNAAVVLRDGRLQEIETRMIVPGDLVKLEEVSTANYSVAYVKTNSKQGTVLPADGRIVTENVRLQIDQSAMTGESLPQSKGYGDTCFSSSLVKRGEALMVVTIIGDDTKMGRMATLVNKAAAGHGDFRRIINHIGIALLGTVIATSSVVWSAGFYRSRAIAPILRQNLAILIIGVPVGLPIVVTTTLAVGAQYLGKKQAIVQRLSAIESLAGVEILCSDKYASSPICMLHG
jgi:H+-transporting ATPase